MIIHSLLPFAIAITGLYSGLYTISLMRKGKIQKDKVLLVNFTILSFLNIYIGVIYILVLAGVVKSVPMSELSLFMRPANFMQILLPFLISKRMGL